MSREILTPPESEFPPSLITPSLDYIKHTAKQVALYPMLIIMGSAFTRGARNAIRERDGNKCVVCGNTDGCECAHINHDKDNPNYNDPSNGRLLCTQHHYTDHYQRHGRNGLTKKGNIWALQKIWQRLTQKQREQVRPPSTIK